MTASRREVLEGLAAASDAERGETTSIRALASVLDAEEGVVEAHLHHLDACELARVHPDGSARVTITGAELLALDPDGSVVVESDTDPEQ